MKRLLVALLMICSWQSNAQDPDPNLFRTWYVNELQITDFEPVIIVSDIFPPILPTLTVNTNLEFSGEAACNTFSGTWTYDGESLISTDLQNSGLDCENSEHDTFEEDYFDFLSFCYIDNIVPDGEGLKLTLRTFLFGYATFRDYILPVDDFEKSGFNIYPNPVSDELFIASENNAVDKATVYSFSGQQLLSSQGQINSLDVSSLSEGIYLLKIVSEGKTQTQKFVKR